jgi:two-component system phosphate regulon sensor histidine kinase PhoR
MRLRFDGSAERRLRLALALFFVALVVPGGLLIARAFGQVQWQQFHHFRTLAEQLAGGVERELDEVVRREEARRFDDYAFDTAGGEPSPLAVYPPPPGLPGLIGYFQVDRDGHFSSPLLPPPRGRDRLDLADSAARRDLDARLRTILERAVAASEPSWTAAAPLVAADADGAAVAAAAAPAYAENLFERLSQAEGARQAVSKSLGNVADLALDARREAKSRAVESDAAAPAPEAPRARRKEQVALLEAPASRQSMRAAATAGASSPGVSSAPRDDAMAASEAAAFADETFMAEAEFGPASAPFAPRADVAAAPPRPAAPQPRVRLFESELDPMSLLALDDDHFVLYRNAWRDGARYIQGAVIERAAFLDALAARAWRGSALATMSEFVVAWHGEVLSVASAEGGRSYASARALSGELLYRARLSAPFAGFELIYSVESLPLGAGARYLAWVGLAMLVVVVAGLVAVDRFGRGHLRLVRQQQDFVSAVSHELKTPLTSIRMYSEMLRNGWGDSAKRETYYGYIHDESERLSRLIGNVLQLARITRGQLRLERRAVAVGALLERLGPRLASQLETAGFELVTTVEPAVRAATVEIDEDALLQCLINLVDNAIKFTPAGAPRRVELTCARDAAGGLTLGVRDFGAGVPRAQMRRIFELFYRGENELTRETVGTGIGLALVRELMQGQGGRVDVANRAPGAEFMLLLPLAAVAAD